MKAKAAGKNTPPKNENLKLRDKSQAISDITHVSQRSYKFAVAPIVKVPSALPSTSTWKSSN